MGEAYISVDQIDTVDDVAAAIDLCLDLDICLDGLDTVEEFKERIRLHFDKKRKGNKKRKVK